MGIILVSLGIISFRPCFDSEYFMKKVIVTNCFRCKNEFRALCSGGWKKTGFSKSVWLFWKMDIYKCPKIKSLFTFKPRKVADFSHLFNYAAKMYQIQFKIMMIISSRLDSWVDSFSARTWNTSIIRYHFLPSSQMCFYSET